MNLGIILLSDSLTEDNIKIIDKTCNNLWDIPSTVRFYDMNKELTENAELKAWCELYFGCRFKVDSPRDSNSQILLSPKLSRSSNSSTNNSPRVTMSPRKLSQTTVRNIQNLSNNCTHIIMIGNHESLSQIIKNFPNHKLNIIVN